MQYVLDDVQTTIAHRLNRYTCQELEKEVLMTSVLNYEKGLFYPNHETISFVYALKSAQESGIVLDIYSSPIKIKDLNDFFIKLVEEYNKNVAKYSNNFKTK
jgi:2-phospho-L-lactate guanylyltransferase (CobY/MobA/RfbA family)